MATVELRYDPKDTAWFTANATMILKAGEPAYHSTTGQFKLGDGTTQLSSLPFLPAGGGGGGNFVPYTGATGNVNLNTNSLLMDNGVTDTEMSPTYFGVEINGGSKFGLLEYDKLTINDSSILKTMTINASGIVFADSTIQTTAAVSSIGVPYTGATGNVNLGEYQLRAGQIELDQSPTGTAGVAITRWNNTLGSTETTLKGGSVVLKNGVDLVARVVNKVTPNTTLTKAAYQVVKVTGAQGQRLAVNLAQANNDNNSADTLGLVTETIATNQEGFIICVGHIENINTTGSLQGESWNDGDVLYLSPTTPGAITKVKPNGSTGHIVVLGYVEYAHQNNGKIYVKVMNGWELD
jgi:nitrogen fixation protein